MLEYRGLITAHLEKIKHMLHLRLQILWPDLPLETNFDILSGDTKSALWCQVYCLVLPLLIQMSLVMNISLFRSTDGCRYMESSVGSGNDTMT